MITTSEIVIFKMAATSQVLIFKYIFCLTFYSHVVPLFILTLGCLVHLLCSKI